MSRRLPWSLAVLLLAGLVSGCASSGAVRPDPWKQYCSAVAATKLPSPAHLSRRLVAIVHSTPKLSWNPDGRVLMATFTHEDCQEKPITCPDQVGKSVQLTGETWLTAVPFLRDFCRQVPPADLGLRLAERLGMPPSSARYYDVLVQVWVDPRAFFRPCADPEVTDGECQLNLTTDAGAGTGCPWAGSFTGQTSAAFVKVSQAHLDWMCSNWTGSYTPPCQSGTTDLPYPWTGLGYTWDWAADNRDHHGESEFVAPTGTQVTVESVTPIAEYCRPK